MFGFTEGQLKSTKSYQEKDLTGIKLGSNDMRGWDFRGQNLTSSSFNSAILTNIDFTGANLTSADFTSVALYGVIFTGANLTSVDFTSAVLSGVNFTDANLTSVNFVSTTFKGAGLTNATIDWADFGGSVSRGFTEKQLRSTKSYQEKNLTGIKFDSNDLSGWDFSGQDLTSSSFGSANLSNVDFTGANLTFVVFSNAILSGTNFTNAYLTSANFCGVDLADTNFTNATVKGADFSETVSRGFTEEQLKSTKSYREKDLTGIKLDSNSMRGWDFRGQNLTSANFYGSSLVGADFTNTDLAAVRFNYANLSNVDLRGARWFYLDGSPIYKNTIMADGVIRNFSMTSAADSFAVRKYQTPARATAISAKISEDNAKISGGAVLSLERGADLIVTNAKTLTVASDGAIAIDTDLSGSTKFPVDHGAGLVFEDGAKLTINVMEDIVGGDALEFTALSWYDDSYIAGLDTIKPNQTLFLNVNGTAYAGDWTYEIKGNSLNISINVPEPSTYAAILGAIALGLAACRRRK